MFSYIARLFVEANASAECAQSCLFSIQSDCKISRFANVYIIPKISNRPLCAEVYI